MTPSKLKAAYQEKHPDGHFFDYKTMRFFGDTMANYGVCDCGEYWELYRRQPVKHGLQGSHYFHKETMADSPRQPQVTT
jgi:hypothetical protein